MIGISLKSFKDLGKEQMPMENPLPENNSQVDVPVVENIPAPEIPIVNPEASVNEVSNVNLEPVVPAVDVSSTAQGINPTLGTPEVQPEPASESSIEPVVLADIPDNIENVSLENTNDTVSFEKPLEPVMPAVDDSDTAQSIEPVFDAPDINTAPASESSAEPVVLEDIPDNIEVVNDNKQESSFDLESELDEPMADEVNEMPQSTEEERVIPNKFLSDEALDKMWDSLNNKVSSNKRENKKEQADEIEKPDIFGEDSPFMKLASKVVSPSPLLPEDIVTNLVPYSNYNDYVFKFGQEHYGKEALTPKEISDLNNVKDFLDGDTFEVERSKQYNAVMDENADLRDRIVHFDNDYKDQVNDMKLEHSSDIEKLGKLIDIANGIISDNRETIDNLEAKNADLNNTVNNQSDTIDSLNSEVSHLNSTIDKLNDNIKELERIKEENESKIKSYENRFKEVLGIVREVKTDN